jgi:hypothetical protein
VTGTFSAARANEPPLVGTDSVDSRLFEHDSAFAWLTSTVDPALVATVQPIGATPEVCSSKSLQSAAAVWVAQKEGHPLAPELAVPLDPPLAEPLVAPDPLEPVEPVVPDPLAAIEPLAVEPVPAAEPAAATEPLPADPLLTDPLAPADPLAAAEPLVPPDPPVDALVPEVGELVPEVTIVPLDEVLPVEAPVVAPPAAPDDPI